MDHALVIGTLVIHLAWIAWVLLGWTLTRGRRVLAWAHVASLGYSIFIEVSQLPCPLTLAKSISSGAPASRPSINRSSSITWKLPSTRTFRPWR
jgi:hypothetical protein